MALRFIKCNQSHLSPLRQVCIQTFTEAFGKANSKVSLINYINRAFSEEQLLSEIENPESIFYLAMAQRQVIGYIKLNEGSAQNKQRGEMHAELERIYLKSEFQRMGFGKILLQKAIDVAKEKGKEFLWLGVWEKNENAISFYEQFGFKKNGTHTFDLGGDQQLDHLMELMLKNN